MEQKNINNEVTQKEKKDTIQKIGFFKKIKYSIRNFEKYPEMAELGVKSSLGYLSKLLIILVFIMSIVTIYPYIKVIENLMEYLNNEIITISYDENGFNLDSQQIIIQKTPLGNIAINTNGEEKDLYNKEDISIEFKKDTFRINNTEYNYEELLQSNGISNFTNEDIINVFSSPKVYISAILVLTIELFIIYFILIIFDALMISLFGIITCLLTKIKMKYKYIFSMSLYALTISILLKFIYNIIYIFTKFEIKYFEIMYTGIAYICLAAAIFMIKSDIVKKYIEMIKLKEIKKKEDKKEIEKEEEEENKRNKEKQKDEKNEETKKKKDEKESKKEDPDINTEGSNA